MLHRKRYCEAIEGLRLWSALHHREPQLLAHLAKFLVAQNEASRSCIHGWACSREIGLLVIDVTRSLPVCPGRYDRPTLVWRLERDRFSSTRSRCGLGFAPGVLAVSVGDFVGRKRRPGRPGVSETSSLSIGLGNVVLLSAFTGWE
jgi:hypothetical protein